MQAVPDTCRTSYIGIRIPILSPRNKLPLYFAGSPDWYVFIKNTNYRNAYLQLFLLAYGLMPLYNNA